MTGSAILAVAAVWVAGTVMWTAVRDWLEVRRVDRDIEAAVRLANTGRAGVWRCWVCPGTPIVVDPTVHSRLAHGHRAVGPEDTEEWTA